MAAETTQTYTFQPTVQSVFTPKQFDKNSASLPVAIPPQPQSKLKPTQISRPVLQPAGVHTPVKTRSK